MNKKQYIRYARKLRKAILNKWLDLNDKYTTEGVGDFPPEIDPIAKGLWSSYYRLTCVINKMTIPRKI